MVRNCDVIKYWLLYIKKVLTMSALTGNNTEAVLSKSELYELSGGDCGYCAEMPLKGKPGVDISVQYCADDFFVGRHFLSATAEKYDKWFSEYAMVLGRDNPQILPFAMLYLESDTFSGDRSNECVFYNLSGAFVKPILPVLLKIHGLSRHEKNLFRIIKLSKDVLVPWLFGFMYSREDFSIRLVCYLTNDGWDKLSELMDKLGYEKFPKADFDCLKELAAREDTGILLNVDVMADGKLGDVIGLEISSLPTKLYEQRKWMEGEAVRHLKGLFTKWDIADERIDRVRDCIFYVGFQPQDAKAFEITSGFSHFKLRWRKGERLPAKVYLQIKRS